MNRLVPVSHTKFIRFLEHIGCKYVRNDGDHLIYSRPDLKRPITFRRIGDIPTFHLKTNLRTLGISTKEFIRIMNILN